VKTRILAAVCTITAVFSIIGAMAVPASGQARTVSSTARSMRTALPVQAGSVARFSDERGRWVRLVKGLESVRFELNPVLNTWVPETKAPNHTANGFVPQIPYAQLEKLTKVGAYHPDYDTIEMLAELLAFNNRAVFSAQELNELGRVIPLGLRQSVKTRNTGDIHGDYAVTSTCTISYAREIVTRNGQRRFVFGSTAHVSNPAMNFDGAENFSHAANVTYIPETPPRRMNVSTHARIGSIYEDSPVGKVGIFDNCFVENGGLELSGGEPIAVGQPRKGFATMRVVTDESGIPRDFYIYVFGARIRSTDENLIKLMDFIILGGQCDVMDIGLGGPFRGNSGAAVIQDGRYIGSVQSVTSHNSETGGTGDSADSDIRYGSAIWAEDHLSRNNEAFERLFLMFDH
jgi:hypothetical protein